MLIFIYLCCLLAAAQLEEARIKNQKAKVKKKIPTR